MEGGAWWATVHGVAKSEVQLSDFTFFLYTYIYMCVCVYIYTGSPASQADSLPSELPNNIPH